MDDATLAERIKKIEDKLDSLEDIERLTELDIINLKNELEKIRLGTTAFVPEDVEERIIKLEKLAEKVEVFENWKKAINEIRILKEKIEGISGQAPPQQPEYEDLRKEIDNLKTMISGSKSESSFDMKMAENLLKRVDMLEQMVRSIKPVRIPPLPQNIASQDEIDELKEKLRDMESELAEVKAEASKPKDAGVSENADNERINELEMKIAALFSRIEDMEKRIKEMPSASDEKIRILEEKVSELEGEEYEEWDDELNELREGIEALRNEINKMKADSSLVEIKSRISSLESSLKNIAKGEGKKMDAAISEIKTSLKALEKRLAKVESSPKGADEKDIKAIKDEIASLRNDLKNAVTKDEFLEFQANLTPPEIPDSKDIEESIKRGILLEKEIEKINKKWGIINRIVKKKDDVDKLKDEMKKQAALISEMAAKLSKISTAPAAEQLAKINAALQKNAQSIEYLRKNQLSKEAEFSKTVSSLQGKIDANSKMIENVMKEMGNFIKTVENARKGSSFDAVKIIKRVEDLSKEIKSVKKELSSKAGEKKVVEFENDVFKEIESMNRAIKSSFEDQNKYVKKLALDVSALSEKIGEIEKISQSAHPDKIDKIAREIEAMKMKLQWLENQISQLDLHSIHEKISEIERRIHIMKRSSPLVIE